MVITRQYKMLAALLVLAVIAYFIFRPKSSNWISGGKPKGGKAKWCVCGLKKNGKLKGCNGTDTDGKHDCSCCKSTL